MFESSEEIIQLIRRSSKLPLTLLLKDPELAWLSDFFVAFVLPNVCDEFCFSDKLCLFFSCPRVLLGALLQLLRRFKIVGFSNFLVFFISNIRYLVFNNYLHGISKLHKDFCFFF